MRRGNVFFYLLIFFISLLSCKKNSAVKNTVITDKDSGKLIAKSNFKDSLKIISQISDSITLKDAIKKVNTIYDTINSHINEDSTNVITLTYEPLHFFELNEEKYALLVVENQAEGYGVNTGWCDLIVFKKVNNSWNIIDQNFNAGGGGMYGNSGQMDGILNTGKNSIGIVLSGGQTHMGSFFFDDIIQFENDKLSNLCSINTSHSYGDWDGADEQFKICEQNDYKFIKSDKAYYDLFIKKTNCLDEAKNKKLNEVTLKYDTDKRGYKIPAAFIFEG